jgi:hypothetical protein
MLLPEASAAAAVPAAVVVTVSVASTDCVFVIVTVAGLKVQVGTLTSPLFVPVTEQVRFTPPVNPPPGRTETAVADAVLPALVAVAGAFRVKESESVCPVPFPQPAVQATTTGADAPEAAKFASPLYVAMMLLLPSVNWETGTSMVPVLK